MFVFMGIPYTVNSEIEDCLLFTFWTFEAKQSTIQVFARVYNIKVRIFTIFSIFYLRQSFIQNSLLLQSLQYPNFQLIFQIRMTPYFTSGQEF